MPDFIQLVEELKHDADYMSLYRRALQEQTRADRMGVIHGMWSMQAIGARCTAAAHIHYLDEYVDARLPVGSRQRREP